ncbi:MAG: beta-lactamase family protein [Ignavibacteria bacterium]|nr:beta-lactamase family protein [Ignavibacteria bacterium]
MKKFLISVILFLLPYSIFAQITLMGKHIDEYVAECMTRWNILGVSVAVIEDGKLTYVKGYGVREIGKPEKVDENTIFAVASNTKAFTGTSIAILESEGKLSIDDRVSKYIPGIRFNNPVTTEMLSIKDVLTHRVGIGTFHGDFITWGTNLSSAELINNLQYVKPVFDYRNGYGYFNSGYVIAGEIIRQVSGKYWTDYVLEKLIGPLGMNRTSLSEKDLQNYDNVVTPHTVDYEYNMTPIPWRNSDNLGPAASINSTAVDMAKWVMMQINEGKYEDKEIISKRVLLRTHTPFNLISLPSHGIGNLANRHFRTYGLGWGISDYKGSLFIEHSGGYDGMVSRTAFLPDKKFGLVILTNNDQNELITSLMYQLFDYALGTEKFNWDSLIFVNTVKDGIHPDKAVWDEIREKKDPNMKPSFEMNELAGTYFNEQAGILKVSKDGSDYNVSISTRPGLKGILRHWRNDTLICKFEDLVVGRCLAPVEANDGKIVMIKIKAADFIDPLYYEFRKSE